MMARAWFCSVSAAEWDQLEEATDYICKETENGRESSRKHEFSLYFNNVHIENKDF